MRIGLHWHKIRKNAKYLQAKLEKLKKAFSTFIRKISGTGFLLGLQLFNDPITVMLACLKQGLLVSTVGKNMLRLTPPLIVGKQHIDKACSILYKVFNNLKEG